MNKKVIMLVLSVVVVLIVLTTTSYALIFNKDRLANNENYTTGNLSIILENDEEGLGNTLTLNNAVPVSDSVGSSSTPYRFKITNNGNLDYEFDLTLTRSGTITGSYVKVKVDNQETVTLTNATTTVATGLKLYAGESMIVNVRVWIDENIPNSEMGKTMSATLGASGVAKVLPILTAADKIISLSQGDTYAAGEGNGVYATNAYDDSGTTKYHEYRYVGGEVNNYVKFNDDLYRIIGVFDDNSHGVEGEWLVKLIAANELTSVSWGVYNKTVTTTYDTYDNYKNNWTGLDSNGTTTNGTGVKASANVILNDYFYNANSTSTTYGECINWTYGSSYDLYKTKNCSNIVGYGIQTETLRNYIQPVTWYLYGYNGNDLNKEDWYQCERNNYTGCTSANSGAYQGTTIAPIGLMYVSDYLYASGYAASNATSLKYAINLNWLYNGEEWTITPYGTQSDFVFWIYGNGLVSMECDAANYSLGIRPTFYLKSTIKIKSGNGTFTSPYIIG